MPSRAHTEGKTRGKNRSDEKRRKNTQAVTGGLEGNEKML
jgi:hypothetical protein